MTDTEMQEMRTERRLKLGLLTVPETADALFKSQRTIWAWIASGQIHSVKIVGRTYVPTREVKRHLKRAKVG